MWSLPVCISHREMVNDSRTHPTHMFLQYSSPHKTLSTVVARGGHSQAVSLTERCWMTLSIYWGAQHNLAPAVRPHYTVLHFITSYCSPNQCITFHNTKLQLAVLLSSATSWKALLLWTERERESVRDEAMHRLGCSYIVNLHWSLVIHQPYWSTLRFLLSEFSSQTQTSCRDRIYLCMYAFRR